MSANAPPFDPLHPTPEQQDDMTAGYLAAGTGRAKPDLASLAYEHGWRMLQDQRELARRWREERGG